jgi:DNA-binding CsgD family transcriptional regulator
MAVLFGDEIEVRVRAFKADFFNPFDVMRIMVTTAGRGLSGVARFRSVLSVLAGGKRAAEMNFRTACEVADVFAKRLGLDEVVRTALGASFERWNGRGLPAGAKGVAIPRPIAHLSQELEVLARVEGIERALEIIRARRGKAYDPDLTDVVLDDGAAWWGAVEPGDPWDTALAIAPPVPALDDDDVHESLLVLADFADLKSPWMSGHSRPRPGGVRAGGRGRRPGPRPGMRGGAHTIWDKPGPLTHDERDRAETHALVTDRRLRYTAGLAATAGGAHERVDGMGYHSRLTGAHLDDAQRVVAAADCYQAMTSDRPHRPAMTAEAAVAELRSMAAGGQLDGEAVERVPAAAGHRRAARPPLPAGLTAREAEVLRLLALGLTTRQVADRLFIWAKTADHHIQRIYAKIGVSTRGAAALFAIEEGILAAEV